MLQPFTSATPSTPSQKPRSIRNHAAAKSDQPTMHDLQSMGIQVRDFAYESTLPRLVPWVQKQIMPGVGPRRENTEPDIETTNNDPLDDEDILERSPSDFTTLASWTSRLRSHRHRPSMQTIQSQFATPPHKEPSLRHFDESQESEVYIHTPIVTPNGSLQWQDAGITSAAPASQLDRASQMLEPDVVSYSQLGFAPPDEYYSQKREDTPTPMHQPSSTLSSPLSSPPSSLERIPGGSLATTSAPAGSGPSSKPSSNPPVKSSASLTEMPRNPPSPPTTNRYHLRKRPAQVPLVPLSPPRRTRRTPPAKPAPRPPPFSAQSAHGAKAKGHPAPVRRRTNTASPVR